MCVCVSLSLSLSLGLSVMIFLLHNCSLKVISVFHVFDTLHGKIGMSKSLFMSAYFSLKTLGG